MRNTRSASPLRAAAALGAHLLLVAGCAATASTPDAATDERVADVFADLDRTDGPGAAVVVIRNGEVVYREGFGIADLEHGIPITPSTVFDIASVSKQFAGISIAMLVESGLVSLDDELSTLLPEMDGFRETITVDHLVHHTSGIRDWPGTLAVAGWRMDDVIAFEQILRMARHQRDLNFRPGAEYSYSNTGYNLLAEIVSRVSETSFRAWTEENIFDPLEMRDTHFHDDHAEVVAGRAQGYQPVEGGFVKAANGLTALGSSSLYTTADDLAKWVVNFDEGRVGGPAVIERMEQRGVLNGGDTIAYAFGQSLGNYRGLETWTHTGSWAGFRTILVRFPEERFGVVVLSNVGDYDPRPAAYEVADIYLGHVLEPRRDASDPTPDQAGGASAPAPAAQLDDYAGTYYSVELDTRYDVSVREGGLVAYHRRHGDIELVHADGDGFRGESWFVPSLEFDRDEAGAVVGFRISQGRSRNLRFELLERP